MTLKKSASPTSYRKIDRWEGGVGWLAHPEEAMERASHALAIDGDVWIIDPVDAPEIDELFADFGTVAGVVVLLDRHMRDAEALARRHDVPLYLPTWIRRSVNGIPVRRFETTLADTGMRALKLFDNPVWQEAALYDETNGTLVVPESVGTADYYRTDRERLGVHPMIRLLPPSELRGLTPSRILVGHGPGVFDDAAVTLANALDGSRRRYPSLLMKTVREVVLT